MSSGSRLPRLQPVPPLSLPRFVLRSTHTRRVKSASDRARALTSDRARGDDPSTLRARITPEVVDVLRVFFPSLPIRTFSRTCLHASTRLHSSSLALSYRQPPGPHSSHFFHENCAIPPAFFRSPNQLSHARPRTLL
eukprot:6207371-Pleurochrysis_carterae.AAC.1